MIRAKTFRTRRHNGRLKKHAACWTRVYVTRDSPGFRWQVYV